MDTENEQLAEQDDFVPFTAEDAMLNLLVHFAQMGVGMSVTLYTSGQVITGNLISEEKYYEKSAHLLRGASSAFASFFDKLIVEARANPADPDEPSPEYRFLHLADARIFVPGSGGMPKEGTLMRFQQNAIVGWSLGMLTLGR